MQIKKYTTLAGIEPAEAINPTVFKTAQNYQHSISVLSLTGIKPVSILVYYGKVLSLNYRDCSHPESD